LFNSEPIVWPKKTKVGNAWLHKAALVTHKKISVCAKFWTDWTIFRGRAFWRLLRYSMNLSKTRVILNVKSVIILMNEQPSYTHYILECYCFVRVHQIQW